MTETRPERLIGCARISTYGQALDTQIAQLHAERGAKICQERASGVQADCRELLIVWLLAQSASDRMPLQSAPDGRNIAFKSLGIWGMSDQTAQKPAAMHRFGVLVPSTNTTVEIEYGRLLPPTLQVHVARIPLLSSGAETTPRGSDADVDYQARLLGSAKVEVVALAQTGASLSSDDFDDRITKRMSDAAGVPAITSARAIALAVRALGARRIALVTPYPVVALKRLVNHYTGKYGLEVVASESFSESDSVLYPELGQELARDAIVRTDRPEIEVFIVPGGNFPTMPFISDWERVVGRPVITTNQAALWAMIQIMQADEKLPNFGCLLEVMPAI